MVTKRKPRGRNVEEERLVSRSKAVRLALLEGDGWLMTSKVSMARPEANQTKPNQNPQTIGYGRSASLSPGLHRKSDEECDFSLTGCLAEKAGSGPARRECRRDLGQALATRTGQLVQVAGNVLPGR